MKTIYKYKLSIASAISIKLPKGSIILTAQEQENMPYIWALIDPNIRETEIHLINMIITGEFFESCPGNYIDTIQLDNGDYVLHIFDSVIG